MSLKATQLIPNSSAVSLVLVIKISPRLTEYFILSTSEVWQHHSYLYTGKIYYVDYSQFE